MRPALFRITLLAICASLPASAQEAANQAEALLSLPAAAPNWANATVALPGADWQPGSDPCGGGGGAAWKGVTCEGGQVVALALPGLGLQGTLPPGLAALPALARLDLSRNAFEGGVPPEWLAPGALPALQLLQVQGNNLSGLLPTAEWTPAGGFAQPAAAVVRPGNPGLAGPVLPIGPEYVDAPGSSAGKSQGYPPCPGGSTASLALAHLGLFEPGTWVTITNWLGSVAQPCPGRNSAAVQTNVFDLSWQKNTSMADIVALNPRGVSTQPPGANISLPCYPDGAPLTAYYGSDVAVGMFAGGNQLAGQEGWAGALAAGCAAASYPNQQGAPAGYAGSQGPGSSLSPVQPLYWFVDLQQPFQVTSVVVTAGSGQPLRNASVLVGSNNTSPLINTLVASGLNLAAGQQAAVATGGALGRYVLVYVGFKTNAAAFKSVSTDFPVDPGASLAPLTDGNFSTCVAIQPDNNGTVLAMLDLGYRAAVGSVVVVLGGAVAPGAFLRAWVRQDVDERPRDAMACTIAPSPIGPSGWAAQPCNLTARYVAVGIGNATGPVSLCELQVGLALPPTLAAPQGSQEGGTPASDGEPTGGGAGLSGGAIAGIVVCCLAGALLFAFFSLYLRWRRRWLRSHPWLLPGGKGASAEDGAAWSADLEGGAPDSLGPLPDGSPASPASPRAASGGGTLTPRAISGEPTGLEGGKAARDEQHSTAERGGRARSAGRGTLELKLLEAFVKSWAHRRRATAWSADHAGAGGRGSTRSQFAVGSAGSANLQRAATDLSKLPPGFADVRREDLTLLQSVGEGSFGEVWVARWCEALVAVKILDRKAKDASQTASELELERLGNLRKEAELMSQLRHPNVTLYLGACTDPPCLVMEYCAKKSLDTLLTEGRRKPQLAKQLGWERLLGMALDAAKGMTYLHSRRVAHRDLKSANLLVDRSWVVKVADFNLSRALDADARASTVCLTNPRWLAPEVLAGQPGQLAADIYAFGTVLWELMAWELPYEDMNCFQIIALVQRLGAAGLEVPPPDRLPAGPLGCYDQYVALMRRCWAPAPDDRPTFAEIARELRDMLQQEVAPRRAAAAAPGPAPSPAAERGVAVASPPEQGAAYNALTAMYRRQAAMMGAAAGGGGAPAAGGSPPSPFSQ